MKLWSISSNQRDPDNWGGLERFFVFPSQRTQVNRERFDDERVLPIFII